jgi:phage terminase Nu1 subunit (DNA packaging protein)
MVTKWIRAGMPTSGGQIDPVVAAKWLRERTRTEQDSQHSEGGSETLADAQRRKEVALADMRELDAQKAKGEVLDTEEVRNAVSGMIMACRAKLLALAGEICDKIAATSDPITVRELLDERIRQALAELAEYPGKGN